MQIAHTHTHTDGQCLPLSHPVPLSLLVEQNDDQLGMHLVSVLTERQISSLKRHIHQVPAEENIEERNRLTHISLAGKYPCHWHLTNVLFVLYIYIHSGSIAQFSNH